MSVSGGGVLHHEDSNGRQVHVALGHCANLFSAG